MNFLKIIYIFSSIYLHSCSENENLNNVGNYKLKVKEDIFLLEGYTAFDIIEYKNKLMAVFIKHDSLCFYDLNQRKITKKANVDFLTGSIKALKIIDNYRVLLADGDIPISIYTINFKGQLLKKTVFDGIRSVKVPPAPALNQSGKYLLHNNTVFMVGSCLGEGDYKKGDRPQGIKYNLGSGKYKYFMDQPEEYYSKNWGGLYYKQSFMTGNGSDEYIFSFPAIHDLIIYNSTTNKRKRVCAGSSKIEEIKPFSKSKTNSPSIKDELVKYYFTNPSYSCVSFDKKNNLYYRMADFPNPKFGQTNEFNKPHSIIILSEEFKFMGETFLDKKNYLQQLYPTSKGLFVPFYDIKKRVTYLTLFEISQDE